MKNPKYIRPLVLTKDFPLEKKNGAEKKQEVYGIEKLNEVMKGAIPPENQKPAVKPPATTLKGPSAAGDASSNSATTSSEAAKKGKFQYSRSFV